MSLAKLLAGPVNDMNDRKWIEAEQLRLQDQSVEQNEQLRQQLAFAHRVQQSLLPTEPPWARDRLAVTCRSVPATTISRDLCVYHELGAERWLLVMGDLGSNGIAATQLMALVVTAIEREAQHHSAPEQLIGAVHERLRDQLRASGLFVALAVVVVDRQRGMLTVANAGMPPLVLWRGGTAQLIELHSVPLGIGPLPTLARWESPLQPDDHVLLLSDGVVEARSPTGELWGYERLLAALEPSASPPQRVTQVLATLAAFVGSAEQHDDRTLLMISP